MADPDILEVKERVAEDLLQLRGVHAVGTGGKVTGGKPTGETAIRVFVREKLPLEEVAPEDRVPAEIDGFKTDVEELPVFKILQAPGLPLGERREEDGRQYRPVRGGAKLTRAFVGQGTLGCLLTVKNDPKTVLALTNHHVLYPEACSEAPGNEQVGQPNGEACSSDCCYDIVGRVLDAQCDEQVDAALVKLDGGTKWLAEVEGVGRIKGPHDITVAESKSHTYQVKKRGFVTGLTGGTVTDINIFGTAYLEDEKTVHRTFRNGILITANPDSAKPGVPTGFGLSGDSGSVVLNAEDKVVGILFGASDAKPAEGGKPAKQGTGVAFPIKDLIEKFAGFAGARKLELEVATAATAGDVRTVPTAMAADAQPVRAGDELGWEVEEEIRTSPRGEVYADVFRRHREEAAGLVHGNRRVTLVWHRSGAAELFQWLVRAFRTPGEKVPAQIQGRPVRACIDEIAVALRRHGSPDLAADLDRLLPALPDVSGLTRAEIVELLKGTDSKPRAGDGVSVGA
jgi:hypothetical protein